MVNHSGRNIGVGLPALKSKNTAEQKPRAARTIFVLVLSFHPLFFTILCAKSSLRQKPKTYEQPQNNKSSHPCKVPLSSKTKSKRNKVTTVKNGFLWKQ